MTVIPAGRYIDIRGGPTVFVPDADSGDAGLSGDAIAETRASAQSSPRDFSAIKPGDLPLVADADSPANSRVTTAAASKYSVRTTSLSAQRTSGGMLRGFAHSGKSECVHVGDSRYSSSDRLSGFRQNGYL
jgi:hypothetical protein